MYCPGGALVIRHQDATLKYDWASSDAKMLEWAAFYSDCEHEVLEVTGGHRVTLTYNLIATPGIGMLAGNCPTIDTTQSLFYQSMKAYLEHLEVEREAPRLLLEITDMLTQSQVAVHSRTLAGTASSSMLMPRM